MSGCPDHDRWNGWDYIDCDKPRRRRHLTERYDDCWHSY
ncbi:hypothetical protein SAMN05443668_114136 [Cryptosporangium aurantiacum]|uniref:Uncharacterized protein n=1 Tax=Cryptosporangium aurantiacum TaxID=134849 RepID=A0A1M7RJG3_9ACTN|nr:hypothetical protein SAMN05443668_114136 [Cryptosporangium aurantiacum]